MVKVVAKTNETSYACGQIIVLVGEVDFRDANGQYVGAAALCASVSTQACGGFCSVAHNQFTCIPAESESAV